MTVDTDMDELPPAFPGHASLPSLRVGALKRFRDRGIQTQATVSPVLPFWEVRDVMVDVLGKNRVLVSCEGFNAV